MQIILFVLVLIIHVFWPPLNLAGADFYSKTHITASIHVLFGSGSHKAVKQL